MQRNGFTLIELVIALAIISILTAFVAPEIFRHVGTARSNAATAQIEMIGGALDSYRLDTGMYPTTEQGLGALWREPVLDPKPRNWQGPYLRKDVPRDPWGQAYVYELAVVGGKRGPTFTLMSYGADGVAGGEGEAADIGL